MIDLKDGEIKFNKNMKKLIVILVVVLFSSCKLEESEEYKYRQTSVLELRQLVNKVETNKETFGSYFLIGGSISSKESTDVYVKVFAKVDGYFRVINIPIKELRVNINNKLVKPTLVIKYWDEKLTDSYVLDYRSYSIEYYIINCPEKYLPENLLPIKL